MKLCSPAKLNLRLKCVGKMENGYHELEMLNIRYPLNDYIYIIKDDKNSLEFVNSNLNPTKDNLVLKVLEYLQEVYNIKDKYKIIIEKNIPVGAGLGGGSSNAATIIKYINEEHKLNLPLSELISIGIKFGADIPYCLFDGPCIVRGIGEKIEEVSFDLKEEIIIVNPNIYISTKDVFVNNKKISNKENIDLINYFEYLENDLEEAAFCVSKELKQVQEYLLSLNLKKVVMSGSGSTFILLVDKDKKEDIYNIIKKETNYLVF
jgi:4-diphosphocytidyl-2-C-methyl-D-erythritol kinase